ncbi:MAG: 1-deoxy-D-xylulose-5-phosphate reductoisomerase [Candidatus Krumholzibacteriota bacterium]|nr:1-deoxy-D-xylulose-5-phosphate reductoisomerase [Candidatus Krumholzibacteriota bacterium]
MKTVVVLGSTGSIGRSTVEVIRNYQVDEFKVVGLVAGSNIEELKKQLVLFKHASFALGSKEALNRITKDTPELTDRAAGYGQKGITDLLSELSPDIVVNAMVGISGLVPTIVALESGSRVALANKETLVTAGEILDKRLDDILDRIIPVDSEHFSLSRLLSGGNEGVDNIFLTASGGPFYKRDSASLRNVKVESVLDHPTWDMGKKVTVDSALLLNKGLEVIEAHWLFGFPYDKIGVVIHPQSIVHSLVRMKDGSLSAHMAPADMKLPIMSALYYPEVQRFPWETLNPGELGTLEFIEFKRDKFPAFNLAMKAARLGGTAPAVLNAADEIAVETFLSGKIGYLTIIDWLEEALSAHNCKPVTDVADVLSADRWTRDFLAGRHNEAIII